MFTDVDWSERDAHMFTRHGLQTWVADEALEDPNRIVIEPDYASKSGASVRIIGYSPTLKTVLTVIVVVDEGREYGASGWESNSKDRSIYYRKGEFDEQGFRPD
jgi:hypothetical protein